MTSKELADRAMEMKEQARVDPDLLNSIKVLVGMTDEDLDRLFVRAKRTENLELAAKLVVARAVNESLRGRI